MASLIGAIRSSMSDGWWIIKLAAASGLLYYAVEKAPAYIPNSSGKLVFYAVIGLLFLGCGVSAMSRNLNNSSPIFPGLMNIPEVLFKSAGAFAAVLTGIVILYFLIYYASLFPMENIVKYIIYALIILFTVPFIIIPLVLFSARSNLFDAFRLGIIFKSAGNFIINFIVYLLQSAFIYVLSFVCLYFFLGQMFGAGHISQHILIYIMAPIVFFTSMIYFSDLYDDVIVAIEEPKPKKKKIR